MTPNLKILSDSTKSVKDLIDMEGVSKGDSLLIDKSNLKAWFTGTPDTVELHLSFNFRGESIESFTSISDCRDINSLQKRILQITNRFTVKILRRLINNSINESIKRP